MHRLLLFLSVCLAFSACSKQVQKPIQESLARKSEPYDHFVFQRSYPDTMFDAAAWRKSVQAADMATQPTIEERSLTCASATDPTPWTFQGPANFAGRVNTLAVKPGDENTVLAGFAGGGIFKTTNGGLTWYPVFDEQAMLSIGHLTFDPNQPETVYAGTGDVNMPSILYNGDGVYKSIDAGESWQYLGLKDAGIVSKIIVHPGDPNVLWVATMGNPYKRGSERGVYKSTDGGQSWIQVLFVDPQAGCSSLVQCAANPAILYASFYDRIRNNFESVNYGPHAKVYKSTDAGQTWQQLGGGLPTGTMGRSGLAVSQQNPDKVYAVFIDSLQTPGALYKSTDGGQNWTALNITSLENACADFGWYFGKITLNPDNDEDLYFHAILLYRRLANGTWQVAAGGHSDSHDLVFCPSGRRYWANDGGVYRNNPNLTIWTKCNNLPATQVYRTNFNPHQPLHYWLGSQDNGINTGNQSTLNTWKNIYSSDGFRSIFHPSDPNTYWVETQNGTMFRTENGGTSWTNGQSAFGTGDRVNWDAPVFQSQFGDHVFYGGTYRLVIGANGTALSPASGDLTDGLVLAPRFHTISALSESPFIAAKIFVGTSDGNVWRKEPLGVLENISAGLPDRYVTSVLGSPSVAQRIFVTHSGFRDDVYIPHIHRSDDNGATWTDISGDLPQAPVNQLFVLPAHADSILFAATDAGVYCSKNKGTNWYPLGNNMPAVPVFDLAHNPVRKQLVAALFGRGIWTYPIDSIFRPVEVMPPVEGLVGRLSVQAEGVEGVQVLPFQQLRSDSSGFFELPSVAACDSLHIRPYLNSDPLNGVSTYDLSLISRHILAIEPLNDPYQLIAADVNRSGMISTFDIVALRRMILGLDTLFPGNTSWRFVPRSFVFSDPTNPFQSPFPEVLGIVPAQINETLNFTAIKTGDLNGSAILNFQSSTDRDISLTPLLVKEQVFEQGDWVEFVIESELPTGSSQLTLYADPAVLELEAVEVHGMGDESPEYLNMIRSSEGITALACEEAAVLNNLSGRYLVARFRFKAKAAGRLSRALALRDAPTLTHIYDTKGKPHRAFLMFEGQFDDFTLYPNPSGSAGAWLQVPAGELLQVIEIYTANGLLVVTQVPGSRSFVHLPAELFPISGTYWLRCIGPTNTKTLRLIVGQH